MKAEGRPTAAWGFFMPQITPQRNRMLGIHMECYSLRSARTIKSRRFHMKKAISVLFAALILGGVAYAKKDVTTMSGCYPYYTVEGRTVYICE